MSDMAGIGKHRQANRKTDRQANIATGKQTNGWTETDSETDKHIDRHTDREIERQMSRHKDRQAVGHTDIHTDMQRQSSTVAGGQTDSGAYTAKTVYTKYIRVSMQVRRYSRTDERVAEV